MNLKLKLSLYVLVFCSNKQKNFYLIKVFFPLHLPRTLNLFFILVSNKVEVFQNRQNSRTNTKIKKKKKSVGVVWSFVCQLLTEFNCSILLNEKTISIVKSMKVTSLMCYLFFYFFCLLFLNQAVYEHAHTHHNGLLKITVTN